MNEQLITLKTAILAKQAGFNVITSPYFYNKDGTLMGSKFRGIVYAKQQLTESKDNIAVHTQSVLHKWLREVHKIYIELIIDGWGSDELVSEEHLCYRAFIWEVGKPRPLPQADLGAANYEKILESALESALQIVIDKNKI